METEELLNVFKFIVHKCDKIINNEKYVADDWVQDNVEDIAELCNHILDGDYGQFRPKYFTDEQIVEAAKKAEQKTGFGELVHSQVSRGVHSAFGIGFLEGAEWTRKQYEKK
jgi:hypothetical protein